MWDHSSDVSNGEELRQSRAGAYQEWWSSCPHISGSWRWCRQYPYTVSRQPGLLTYKQTMKVLISFLSEISLKPQLLGCVSRLPTTLYVDKGSGCLNACSRCVWMCYDITVFVHVPSILASAYTTSRSTFDVEYQREPHSLKSRKTQRAD